MNIRGVRLENVFWMLAYAWDELSEAKAVSASLAHTGSPSAPLAACFLAGVERLVRQGFCQNYVKERSRSSTLRGRLLPLSTVQAGGLSTGQVWCEHDRLSIDVLPNQIIRTALRQIDQSPEHSDSLRKRARALDRRFDGVQILNRMPADFTILNLGGQRRGYRFLLTLAKFILTDLKPVGLGGSGQFVEVNLEKSINMIFERFVRNFLAIEQIQYKVRKTRRPWANAFPQNAEAETLLPTFETDIVLTEPGKTILIDTKFYGETLRKYRGVTRVREAHLYQLLGYLHNMKFSVSGKLEGVLLYPLAQGAIDARWIIHGFPVRVFTLDLSMPWEDVSSALLDLASTGASG